MLRFTVNDEKEADMIWMLIVVILGFWLVGFLAGVNGAVIHLLLLLAGMLLLEKLLAPRPLR